MLLGDSANAGGEQYKLTENKAVDDKVPASPIPPKKSRIGLIIAICVAALVVFGIVVAIILIGSNANGEGADDTTASSENDTMTGSTTDNTAAQVSDSTAADVPELDLFTYCKNFAIEKGELNGDYCIYQQSSVLYGGRENEYFSISYWSDSDMVEFCLHCPLSDTLSHNFYLRMRGGYDGEYEYSSSKYYRDTGESLRAAYGYIDPTAFYDGYPIPCDEYIGDSDGQTQFMEDSRVGICDLIRCLKEFVEVEEMECDFTDFGFIKF